jgi:hypothetical protein
MRHLLTWLCFFFALCSIAPAQTISAPFFNDTSQVEVCLRGDLKALFKDDDDEREYHPMTFVVYPSSGSDSVSVPVRIMTRGNYRRSICKLPPLKFNFKKEDVAGSYLDGLDKVKLVLPCRENKDNYNELVQMEYLAYRLYNRLTDSSFRVRPLHIRFEDTEGKYDPFEQFGFFIEPLDLLAQRLNAWEIETENIHPNSTQTELTTLMSLFQYMVGNTDWSIPGLHNIKLVKTDTFALPLAIPYDFDFCGLVDAPYAKPNPQLGITDVKDRVFRGFCRPQAEMDRVYARFQSQRAALYAEVEGWTMLPENVRKRAQKYLDEFFDTLDSDRRRAFNFEESCRK